MRNVLIGVGIILAISVITVAILQLKGRAEFEVTSLTISPEVEAGENFTITAIIKNVGESKGTFTAILFIGDVQVEAKNVTIPAGATRTVHFSLVEDIEGTYIAKVGGVSKTFTVGIPFKIMAEDCLIEEDNKIIKSFAITEMENSEIEDIGCERGLYVHYYDEENRSPPYLPHTLGIIYQFSSLDQAHNFFENVALIKENWASEENVFLRINVGDEGFYSRPMYQPPEIFFRIKNCIISFFDFRGEGTGKGWVYAVILSERFKPPVEVSWKREKFEAEDEEFLLENDVKGMYVENYFPDEMLGLERSIIIHYYDENYEGIITEVVYQFQDNVKAHESLENLQITHDYVIGPVKLGDEGYVFAFAPKWEIVPGVTFRIRNVQVMLLSLYGPDTSLALCKIIEEKCRE